MLRAELEGCEAELVGERQDHQTRLELAQAGHRLELLVFAAHQAELHSAARASAGESELRSALDEHSLYCAARSERWQFQERSDREEQEMEAGALRRELASAQARFAAEEEAQEQSLRELTAELGAEREARGGEVEAAQALLLEEARATDPGPPDPGEAAEGEPSAFLETALCRLLGGGVRLEECRGSGAQPVTLRLSADLQVLTLGIWRIPLPDVAQVLPCETEGWSPSESGSRGFVITLAGPDRRSIHLRSGDAEAYASALGGLQALLTVVRLKGSLLF